MNMLELWIHSVIKKLFAEDQTFRNYLGKTSLEKVSKEDVQKYKMFKLRKPSTTFTKNHHIIRNVSTNTILNQKISKPSKIW